MAYQKNDILIFLTKEPGAHVCEMFGHGIVNPEDAEREPYYGFVKSVISVSKGIYLMQTLKPLEGFFCVADDSDVIRIVDKTELPEEERERQHHELYEAPNVYIPAQNANPATLTEQEHCIALAKEALTHLFPDIPATEFELRGDWFSKSGFISTLNYFDEDWETIKNPETKKELGQLKNKILKDLQSARFKEYYTVNVGTRIDNWTHYFIVAVSMEFDEVSILRDITERSNFFRSLGPEFNDIDEAVNFYRDKVMEAIAEESEEKSIEEL